MPVRRRMQGWAGPRAHPPDACFTPDAIVRRQLLLRGRSSHAARADPAAHSGRKHQRTEFARPRRRSKQPHPTVCADAPPRVRAPRGLRECRFGCRSDRLGPRNAGAAGCRRLRERPVIGKPPLPTRRRCRTRRASASLGVAGMLGAPLAQLRQRPRPPSAFCSQTLRESRLRLSASMRTSSHPAPR
jgi:hypothetical protein